MHAWITTHGVFQLLGAWSWCKWNTTTHRRLHVATLTGDIYKRICMVIAENNDQWKESNMLPCLQSCSEVSTRNTCTVMTLCVNMRVQRIPRTPSTTPVRALLSTADEPGSLSYICVQCCPARSKCGM